jgi:hypothetical protein
MRSVQWPIFEPFLRMLPTLRLMSRPRHVRAAQHSARHVVDIVCVVWPGQACCCGDVRHQGEVELEWRAVHNSGSEAIFSVLVCAHAQDAQVVAVAQS